MLYSARVQYLPSSHSWNSSPWYRCNISHIFTFSLQFLCRAVPLIYITIFREDSKRGGVVGGGEWLWGHNHLFQDWFV